MSNLPFNNEELSGSIAGVLMQMGHALEVGILATATSSLDESSYDNWNGGTTGYTLTLSVPQNLYGTIGERCAALEEAIKIIGQNFFKGTPNQFLNEVKIVPVINVATEWRSEALAWATGRGITNQGRVRSDNVAARSYDGLLFRSNAEINLYRELKSLGVTFAPLPVFLRGGEEYRRIEPDFIIVKEGVMLHVEVDGDTVHQESPVEAHVRTTLLLYEGVRLERVSASAQ